MLYCVLYLCELLVGLQPEESDKSSPWFENQNVDEETQLGQDAEPHWHTGQDEEDGEQFAQICPTHHVSVA